LIGALWIYRYLFLLPRTRSRGVLIAMNKNNKLSDAYRITPPLKQTTTHSLSLARQSAGPEWDSVLKDFTPDLFPTGEQREIFFQEMQKLTKLDHPHILALRDVKLEGDHIYTVTPHAARGSLQDRFNQQQGRFPPSEIYFIITQIGLALQYVHSQGILHTNLKPDNILFPEPDVPCLADFSPLCLTLQRPSRHISYAAPEELNNQFSPQSDQYALAAITYELLTGKIPHASSTHASNWNYIVQSPSSINPAISPDTDQVLVKALSPNPSERYPTVKAYIDALNNARHPVEATSSSGVTTQELQPIIGTRLPDTPRKRMSGWKRGVLIALTVLLILLAVFASRLLMSESPRSSDLNVQHSSSASAVTIHPPTIPSISKTSSVSTSTPGLAPTSTSVPIVVVPVQPTPTLGVTIPALGPTPTSAPSTPVPSTPTQSSAISQAPTGATIWLNVTSVGLYVSARLDTDNKILRAEAQNVSSWESFAVVDAGNGTIALRESAYGNYVSAWTADANTPLEARSAQIQTTETFRWIDLGNSTVALQAVINGKYVSAWSAETKSPLEARSDQIQAQETFLWGKV
jgi:serine/threonine protein kinase